MCNKHCLYKNMNMWHELTNGVVTEPRKETSTIALLQKFIDKLISHLFVIPSIKVPRKKRVLIRFKWFVFKKRK